MNRRSDLSLRSLARTRPDDATLPEPGVFEHGVRSHRRSLADHDLRSDHGERPDLHTWGEIGTGIDDHRGVDRR